MNILFFCETQLRSPIMSASRFIGSHTTIDKTRFCEVLNYLISENMMEYEKGVRLFNNYYQDGVIDDFMASYDNPPGAIRDIYLKKSLNKYFDSLIKTFKEQKERDLPASIEKFKADIQIIWKKNSHVEAGRLTKSHELIYTDFYKVLSTGHQTIVITGNRSIGKTTQYNYLTYLWCNNKWNTLKDMLLLNIRVKQIKNLNELFDEIIKQNFVGVAPLITADMLKNLFETYTSRIVLFIDDSNERFCDENSFKQFFKTFELKIKVIFWTRYWESDESSNDLCYKLNGLNENHLVNLLNNTYGSWSKISNFIENLKGAHKFKKKLFQIPPLAKELYKMYKDFKENDVHNFWSLELYHFYEFIFRLICPEHYFKDKNDREIFMNELCKECFNSIKFRKDKNIIHRDNLILKFDTNNYDIKHILRFFAGFHEKNHNTSELEFYFYDTSFAVYFAAKYIRKKKRCCLNISEKFLFEILDFIKSSGKEIWPIIKNDPYIKNLYKAAKYVRKIFEYDSLKEMKLNIYGPLDEFILRNMITCHVHSLNILILKLNSIKLCNFFQILVKRSSCISTLKIIQRDFAVTDADFLIYYSIKLFTDHKLRHLILNDLDIKTEDNLRNFTVNVNKKNINMLSMEFFNIEFENNVPFNFKSNLEIQYHIVFNFCGFFANHCTYCYVYANQLAEFQEFLRSYSAQKIEKDPLQKVRSLEICNFDMDYESMVKLLKQKEDLKYLKLTNINILESLNLLNFLQHLQLESVQLKRVNIICSTDHVNFDIFKNLKFFQNIKQFNLKCCTITGSCFSWEDLLAGLQKCKRRIEKLTISSQSFLFEDPYQSLENSFSGFYKLQELNFSNNYDICIILENLFENLYDSKSSLKLINLSSCNLGIESGETLTRWLCQFKNLQHVNFKNNQNIGLNFIHILKGLSGLSIESLNLSSCDLRRHQHVENLLSNFKSLKLLDLSENHKLRLTLEKVINGLFNSRNSLQNLNLSLCQLEVNNREALRNNRTTFENLRYFNLSGNNLQGCQIDDIFESFNGPNLTYINLKNCNLKVTANITQILSRFKSIRKANFSQNFFDSLELKYLLNGVRNASKIEYIYLSSCNLEINRQVFQTNNLTNLKILDLHDNKTRNISLEKFCEGFIKSGQSLIKLDLSQCDFYINNNNNMSYVMNNFNNLIEINFSENNLKQTLESILGYLKYSRFTLEIINLAQSHVSVENSDTVVEELLQFKKLRIFSCNDNNLSGLTVDKLFRGFFKSLKYLECVYVQNCNLTINKDEYKSIMQKFEGLECINFSDNDLSNANLVAILTGLLSSKNSLRNLLLNRCQLPVGKSERSREIILSFHKGKFNLECQEEKALKDVRETFLY